LRATRKAQSLKIQFLGASQQVTGSSYFVEAAGLRLRRLRPLSGGLISKGINPFPVSPESIDFVLLTHVHLDHSGLLPSLSARASEQILMTPATADLL
jgi:metallo-beta-lactamase family protein